MKKRFSGKLGLSAAALSAALLLSSCVTSSGPAVSTAQAFAPLQGTLGQYQQQAASASGDSYFPAQLLLARAQIVSGSFPAADQTLQALKDEAITPLQMDYINIIEGLSLSQQQEYARSYALLSKVNQLTLPPQAASYYYQLISNVELKLYQAGGDEQYLRSAFEHKRQLITFLSGADRAAVLQQTIELLKELSPSELSAALTRTADQDEAGYLEYAVIDSSANEALKSRLTESWQKKYPSHPLNQLLGGTGAAGSTAAAVTASPEGPTAPAQYAALKPGDKVAVLLPLTGRFARSVGEPARLGIIAALKDRNLNLSAVFYDTNVLPIEEIVARVKADGTAFIIGPVLRPEVEALLNAKSGLPTILLNTPQQALPANTWYFNLGPEYEGQVAASKMALDGARAPLIIYTNNDKARRAAAGFQQTWQQASGRTAPSCALIEPDARAAALRCPFTAADAVYIAATAQEAPQVKSALPAAMKTYITDQAYNGVNSSPNEALLAGAVLGDMPWVITDSSLKADFMQTLPKAQPQVQRIFAAAYDSVHFALNINNLAQNPADVLHGLSGDLQLGRDGLIETAPLWLTISFPRSE